MKKEKIIIYGLGENYQNPFFQKFILSELQARFEIIGVSDKLPPQSDNSIAFPFIKRSLELRKADRILVTSNKFFKEIKDELRADFGITNVVHVDKIEEEFVNEKFHSELFCNCNGVEIGGPSFAFRFLYKKIKKCDGVNYSSNTVWWNDNGEGYTYNNHRLGDLLIADAVALSIIADNTYDFCLSSNNLEHIANPLKAVKEFIRIVKPGGILLIVVPRKEDCFDHRREITSFSHLLDDFNNEMDEHDMTHLDEILRLHDYELDVGVESAEEFKERAKDNYNNRCLHHHVFDENLLEQIYDFFNVEIIDEGIVYGNYFALGRIKK